MTPDARWGVAILIVLTLAAWSLTVILSWAIWRFITWL
jgi:hypothetical protein